MKNNSYLEIFPEIFEEIKESQQKQIEKIKNKNIKKNFFDRYIYSVLSDYKSVGIGEWLVNKDAIAAKKNFYLAAKLQEILFRKYDEKEIQVQDCYVSMSSYLDLLSGLLSDSQLLIESLANLMGNRPEAEEDGHPFADNVGYALKYIILKEDEKAKVNVDKLLEMEDNKELKLRIGYARVLKAILEQDEKQLNENLSMMLRDYKKDKDYEEGPEEFFSIPVLAFAKLALMRGLKIEIEDPIVPKRFFEQDEIEYPSIDYLD